jgi:hypothetical protein
MELREQCWLDALSGLVAGPKLIAERLDYVISGHADVGGTTFDHLQDSVQYADDSAERLVLAVVESALAIEMAKQLVGAIYQVDNHEESVPQLKSQL